MAEINAERTTFCIRTDQSRFKNYVCCCSFAEQQHLLALSTQMYNNLTVDRTLPQQVAFEAYAFDLSQHPTYSANTF